MSLSHLKSFVDGCVMMLPLNIAIIPWGILAGSVAVDAGLDILQSQAMSVLVFAGAAQLIGAAMIKAGAGLFAIVMTTLIVTSRHLLYSMALRESIKGLPLRWRLALGFLLTDELFAVARLFNRAPTPEQPLCFDRWYALGAGLSFYLIWNLASWVGILMGQQVPNLNQWGLDFAIVAMFIAITLPSLVNVSTVVTVLMALLLSVLFELLHVEAGLLLASLLAMLCGFGVAKWRGEVVSV